LRTPAAEATVAAPLGVEVAEGMYAFLNLVDTVIRIYIWLLIIQAVLSWLIAFGVVNRHNRIVGTIEDFLWRITEPALRPLRRILPNLGGIDISPIILILLLYFIRNLMFEYLA
jgi:YggT family protein